MKVKQPILTKVEGPSLVYAITSRVELSCSLVEEIDGQRVTVALLEAGAGLETGAKITVNSTEIVAD